MSGKGGVGGFVEKGKSKIARDIARVLNALARVIRAIANLVDVINW